MLGPRVKLSFRRTDPWTQTQTQTQGRAFSMHGSLSLDTLNSFEQPWPKACLLLYLVTLVRSQGGYIFSVYFNQRGNFCRAKQPVTLAHTLSIESDVMYFTSIALACLKVDFENVRTVSKLK